MKQVLQDLKGGNTFVADVPKPRAIPNHVVVQTRASLISPGTERMLRDFGNAGVLSKALQQPDKVRLVCQKIKTDGFVSTYKAIANKLEQSLPLGYCNAGIIKEVVRGSRWKEGQRIVSNAYHAEYVLAPENLCAAIPGNVSDDEASFAIAGAIAMQGVRLANPQIGESFAVIGLGLIGLLTVQILKANGCNVIGIDLDESRMALAERFGAENLNHDLEMDGVLIAASTNSDKVISQAAQMCRKRGRIVLLGVVGLNLSRADFYEKEITFQVSCSYGPGRYDDHYEMGQDYPAGFVRWTAQRNIEAVLNLIASGKLDVKPMISHRFKLEHADQAYDIISGREASLGIVIEYPEKKTPCNVSLPASIIRYRENKPAGNAPNVAFIGAGNFATSILAPSFKKAGAVLQSAVSQRGVSSYNVSQKFGFAEATTEFDLVFKDNKIDTVVIATRHNSHADLVVQALKHKKHVFVEKPLALNQSQLSKIENEVRKCSSENSPILMIGFNRRFSPLIQEMKPLLAKSTSPKAMVITVNAEAVNSRHWTQDLKVGGGRIIGEACHFIDLLRYLSGHSIESITTSAILYATADTATINLSFADGSIGTIHYFANGHKSVSKERLEIFWDDKIMQLDNFRMLKMHGLSGRRSKRLWRQDKGHQTCVATFCNAIQSGDPPPIPLGEIFEVSRAAIKADELIRSGRAI